MSDAPATNDEITQVLSVLLPSVVSDNEFKARLRCLVRVGVLAPDPERQGAVKVNQEHPDFVQTLALIRAEATHQ